MKNKMQSDNLALLSKNVTVSVVIATYRRDISLKKALRSVINQTYEHTEIIVVDDNAEIEWNNNVKGIIDEINLIHPIIYIQNETNQGSAETRNIGIRKASGEYITFLDDDDLYLPNKIKNQIEHMKEKNSDYCITDIYLYDENERLIEKRNRKYIKINKRNDLLGYHLMYHMTGTDTLMFKRDYLLNIGGFPSIDVGDEFYLVLRAIELNGLFTYLPVCDVKAYVHTTTDGLSSGESKINGENELYKFKRKYFNALEFRDKQYIKMRHYAVIAYAEMRRKRYVFFIKNIIKSFFISPLSCINMFIQRFMI